MPGYEPNDILDHNRDTVTGRLREQPARRWGYSPECYNPCPR
jgi:hypothetical protein